MKTKICYKCKKEKDINEFYSNIKNKDKLGSYCKKCNNAMARKWHKNNLEYMKEYYQYSRNREYTKETNKRFKENNPEYFKEYQREYKKKNPIKAWCYQTIAQHKYKLKKRGIKFLFNSVDLYKIAKIIKYCPICDTKLNWDIGNKGSGPRNNSPTLDRKKNNNTLTLNNIQILCRKCNSSKQDRTMKELVCWCKKVIDKFGEINETKE